MTRLSFKIVSMVLGLLFIGGSTAFAAAAREPEDLWQELLRLPNDERQKRLVAGAKAEGGKAIIYGNISSDHLERLRVDFDKRYGIKIDGYRASGERVANRLLTEARSGKLDADVIAPSNEHMPALIKGGVAGRYNSPERAAYPETNKDKLGYWTAYDYNMAVIAYNTRLVSAAEAPKKYDDFLDPKWKGNFAIDLYAYRLADLKHTRGCPVELSFPDPTPATPSPVGIVKRTPRPYSAALLLDYILSEPAQRIFTEAGRTSGRRGIKPRYSDLDIEAKGVKILLLTPDDAVQFDKPYQQLREEFLLNR